MGTQDIMVNANIQVDISTIENIKNFTLTYLEDEDTLFIRPDKPCPATSFDWNGEIWIRVNPKNGEIVGLEIDDFKAIFLKKNPEVAIAWEKVKPSHYRKLSRKHEHSDWDSFTNIVLNFILVFFRDNPQQARFSIV